MTTPLLVTKFHIPAPRAEFVRRPRLLEPLDAPGKLTLISAPAGFGKTTLASCWLTRQGRRVAWLALDEGDNDSQRFFTYLITALNRADPAIGQIALDALRSPDLPSIPTLFSHLINDLAQSPQQFILALDDYHLIHTQTIHDGLTFLLEHLPPQLHLVIISRAEPPLPIAKLRSKNELVELHGPDLRFTWAETETFLNQTMRLGLSGEQITQIEAHTQGWITGLQLTALTIKNTVDAAKLINTISGDNRYIADYLIDEVLSQQPEHIQQFLLQTSVLGRLSASLCNAVVGIEDSQVILEMLEKSNLFVIPLDDTREWYRYHHLFAEMLRSRLEHHYPENMSQLYRQAVDWHKTHNLLEEAIRYALNGQMYAEAADIVEKIGQDIYWRNRAHRVQEWLEALPDGLLQTRPNLRILYAYGQIDQGDMQGVERTLQRLRADLAQQALDSSEANLILQGKIAAIETSVAFHRNLDYTRGEELARQALELLPADYHYERCVASFHGAGFLILQSKLDEARQYLQEALKLSDLANTPVARPLILSNMGHLEVTAGALTQAHHYYQTAYNVAHRINVRQSSTFSGAVIGLASLHYEWNDLDTASTYLQEGLELVEQGEFLDRLVFGYTVAVRMYCLQRKFDQVHDILQRAGQFVIQYNAPPKIVQELEVLSAAAALAEENLRQVAAWTAKFSVQPDGHTLISYDLGLTTLVRFFIARKDFDAAIHWLAQPLNLARRQGCYQRVITAEILLAKVFCLQGDRTQGLEHLGQALALAESEGFIRVFLDEGEPIKNLLMQLPKNRQQEVFSTEYVQTLLNHFEGEPTPPLSAIELAVLSIKLTPRELEVLRHLESGLSYADIAAQLIITENTLRYHIKNIYGKLNVKNRMQAVSAARKLGLLSGM